MRKLLARKHFKELNEFERLIDSFGDLAQVRVVDQATYEDRSYPLYVLTLGTTDKSAPALGFFGGVHGLEKIGSEVVLSYLETVRSLLEWDSDFRHRLEQTRLVFMPLVNPVGIVMRWRANGNGVDLMRNAPVDAEGSLGPLYRGHRISPRLPWYRGQRNAEMEVEAKALCQVVEEELLTSKCAMAVDVHSGFGARDRFWFPWAKTLEPCPHAAEAFALMELFDRTYPHHFYQVEPTASQYTIHGDLWDYLYERSLDREGHFFMPWTLEMGSWMWLKKSPMHIFTRYGAFHPIKPHRQQRILRRHLGLFDFLHRSLMVPEVWLGLEDERRQSHQQKALERWYE